jgi:peptide/nickel transport system substrate-binding protein
MNIRPLFATALLAASTLVAPALAAPALAAEARIGVQTETSSIDPHYAVVGANQAIARQIFEGLLGTDEAMRPAPGLAASWRPIGGGGDDEGWEFKLRPGAQFSDGTPVTAEDVRFSLERMPKVPGSPAPFIRLSGITRAIEVVAPDTIRILTRGFTPAVPLYAVQAWIVSARAARDASPADFNAGRAALGSGPWRFVEWRPGERLVLERVHEGPAFERATFRPIGSAAARVSALLAGDVDLIDAVPPSDVDLLRANPKVKLWNAASARFIYIAFDQEHAASAQVRGNDGKPLATNPLKDARVRRALSLAVNRALIVERILHGAGRAAGQMVPEGFVGYDPAIGVPGFDPAAARRLLAEAGYPQGFHITLTSPNNRYVEDAPTAQAVAQMWSRVGVITEVEVMPSNAFFARSAKGEFSSFLIGFGASVGDGYAGMAQVLHSYDPAHGLGGLNRTRFADPAVDAALELSERERDPVARAAALGEAARVGLERDVALLALHFPDNVWATRAGFAYTPAMEEATLAALLRPAP